MKKWFLNNKFNILTWGAVFIIVLVVVIILVSLYGDIMSGTGLMM